MNEHDALRRAVEAGGRSPCAKSKRGVAIWTGDEDPWESRIGWLSVEGFNHPPAPFACDGSAACREACRDICVHAEAHAIRFAGMRCLGASMLHVKVVDGEAVSSGPPSCVRCSALILDAGITWMWLLHDDGLKRYSAEEFHQLSLEHHGLPVHRG